MSFQLLTFVNGNKTVENFSKVYFLLKINTISFFNDTNGSI